MLSKRLVGILGSGLIGYDPFDRRCWSGISYYLFNELTKRHALHRAFGAEVNPLPKLLLRLGQIHPDREVWRRHYYMSRAYREALTAEVLGRLEPDDFEHDFFQIGAMYDVPRLVARRARCFSYNDGNLVQSLKSPYSPTNLSVKRVDEGLRFEREVNHGLDRIFVMSHYLRRSFIEDYGVPADRVSNVGAGVNLDTIPEPSSTKRYDTQQVLFIGVDFPRKGGPQLLEAFRQVRTTHPRATLHIVGPHSLFIPPGLDGGVQYHGFLSKSNPTSWDTLRHLFERCSLFVMPSLYEPFGIAPLEAMLYQMPAVVSRAWALEETVQPGVTGAHVEPGSVDDLVDRLTTLLAAPEDLKRMGEAARERVLRHHTWPQVVERMVSEIQSVQDNVAPSQLTAANVRS